MLHVPKDIEEFYRNQLKMLLLNIIAVRGVGVPFIYTARPEGVRKMGCDTKRLWPERA